MSQQYIRGPVCGTDNCPSRLYRSVDGLKMCQYGHVLEGEIEINDDNEGGLGDGVMTRRLGLKVGELSGKLELRRGRISDDKHLGPKRLTGNQGKEIHLRALQIILKLQLKHLIKELFPHDEKFAKELLMVVKANWIKTLDSYIAKDNRDSDTFSVKASTRLPGVLDTVFVLYYSVLKLNFYPLYLTDLIHLIRLDKIPVFNTVRLLPKFYQDRIPIRTRYALQLYRFNEGIFYRKFGVFSKKFPVLLVPLKSINYYYPFLLKQFQEVLLLPNSIELFVLTNNLIRKIDYKFNYNHTQSPGGRGLITPCKYMPDILVVCFMIITIKIHFIYVNNKIDYKAWLNNLSKLDFNSTDFTMFDCNSSNDLIYDLINWSDEKINNYCNYLNYIFIPNQSSELSNELSNELLIAQLNQSYQVKRSNTNQAAITLERLFQIFDYDSIESESNGANTSFDIPDINLEHYLSSYSREDLERTNYKDIFIIENQLFERYCRIFNIDKPSFYSHYQYLELLIKQYLKGNELTQEPSQSNGDKV